jgi:hypothetical protein
MLLFAAANVEAQQQKPPGQSVNEEAANEPAAKALGALDKAGEAIGQWRKAIEAGAELTDEDLNSFQASASELYGDLQWIFEHKQSERRAQRQAEDRIQSVPQQRELTNGWIEHMRAIGPGSAERRAKAIAELRSALEGNDRGRNYAALTALQQVGDVNYDKSVFRPLILPFVKHAKGHTFVSAADALHHAGQEPGDLELIRQAWDRRTPALDGSMAHLLFKFGDGKFEGRSEEIMLELLASPEADVRREGLRGLWGASVSDKLAARIVELADEPESHGDAVYFGLSTLKPKNEAVVDKLIETLGDRDWTNNASRALWGLGYGVPKELQPKVAAAAAELYAARSDPRAREQAREIIRNYAGPAAVEALPK